MPPTVSVPVPTANVISAVAVVGCTVMLPVQFSVPPLNVIVMLAPLAAVLKLALAHWSVLPEERLMLWLTVAAFVRAPLRVRSAFKVRVEAATLPYVREAIEVATANVGWLVIAACPI